MTLRRSAVPFLVVLAAAGASCRKVESEGAAGFRASVVTAAVETGRIERTVVTTGTVRAASSAKAVTESAGRLTLSRNPRTGRRWSIGDDIRRGELLAVIAPDEAATQSRVQARRQALAVARADHARYASLHEQGLLSALQMAEQETRLANAEAELRAAELQESKSRLSAPIGGVLASVTTSPDGELVTERQSLAEIMELGELLVDLDLGAGDILAVRPGLDVRVTVPGTDVTVPGSVARVAPAIDPKTRTFRVEVALAPSDTVVRPGMFVRAEIVAEKREGVPLVPAAAVVVREGAPVVFVVEAQRAQRRSVTLGLASEEKAEIVEGVGAGELVVVSGQETLDDGVKVVVRE